MTVVSKTVSSDAASFEIVPSASRIAAPSDSEYTITGRGYGYHGGLFLFLNVTASTTTTLTVTVKGVDKVSNNTWTVLTSSAALGPVAFTVFRIAPGLTPVANLTVNDFVPKVFRVIVAHAGVAAITYSLSGMLI